MRTKSRTRTRTRPAATPRTIVLDDPLGFLVPPGLLTERQLARDLREVMDRKRFRAGMGVPSVPTRYVVTMHPADRAWFHPWTEDRLARLLTDHAESCGALIVGDIRIEFETDEAVGLGRPKYWAGFVEDDLLVLADPGAAADVFERSR